MTEVSKQTSRAGNHRDQRRRLLSSHGPASPGHLLCAAAACPQLTGAAPPSQLGPPAETVGHHPPARDHHRHHSSVARISVPPWERGWRGRWCRATAWSCSASIAAAKLRSFTDSNSRGSLKIEPPFVSTVKRYSLKTGSVIISSFYSIYFCSKSGYY